MTKKVISINFLSVLSVFLAKPVWANQCYPYEVVDGSYRVIELQLRESRRIPSICSNAFVAHGIKFTQEFYPYSEWKTVWYFRVDPGETFVVNHLDAGELGYIFIEDSPGKCSFTGTYVDDVQTVNFGTVENGVQNYGVTFSRHRLNFKLLDHGQRIGDKDPVPITDTLLPNCQPYDLPDDPPDDECPNLNLTIRGTLLPARRGTARVSGDWCK